ncbi:hypothetical protein Osc7112_1995 [Oscillatoria nigro-viridis PCC 7112]|uniref:Uncharacterized protein n=1 Tax=Phormidium nigroviride PCC 7112 TaxID=179408 RepID=K9VG24_9CYAN|nr:hypothetical protein Osc7112_1995 [Oscillatoria nigro-viridis PCC 7112]
MNRNSNSFWRICRIGFGEEWLGKGSDSMIQARVNIKLEQIRPSDDVAPGYVGLTE